jgi:hypothetical protein
MIAFKTKQAQSYTDSDLKAHSRVIIAAVTEINIDIIQDLYRVFWNYFYIDQVDGEDEMIKAFPNKPGTVKMYTRQKVWDYHTANSSITGVLPDVIDAIFFKSLKKQVVDDGILGLGASDWEAHNA